MPGEAVRQDGGAVLITSERHVVTPDRVNLKIVGYADSASQSAGGWVTPDQARPCTRPPYR
ncbi:hypothetical protein [Kitasatospora sp. NPDC001175]|uniref:hypothetical protein n=1 Tax=Kitasatospora sp. NPDC001175 TaxID=3157103 RepID=UPI003D031AC2